MLQADADVRSESSSPCHLAQAGALASQQLLVAQRAIRLAVQEGEEPAHVGARGSAMAAPGGCMRLHCVCRVGGRCSGRCAAKCDGRAAFMRISRSDTKYGGA